MLTNSIADGSIYQVTFEVAKSKKHHTIQEEIIKTCALEWLQLFSEMKQKRRSK